MKTTVPPYSIRIVSFNIGLVLIQLIEKDIKYTFKKPSLWTVVFVVIWSWFDSNTCVLHLVNDQMPVMCASTMVETYVFS